MASLFTSSNAYHHLCGDLHPRHHRRHLHAPRPRRHRHRPPLGPGRHRPHHRPAARPSLYPTRRPQFPRPRHASPAFLDTTGPDPHPLPIDEALTTAFLAPHSYTGEAPRRNRRPRLPHHPRNALLRTHPHAHNKLPTQPVRLAAPRGVHPARLPLRPPRPHPGRSRPRPHRRPNPRPGSLRRPATRRRPLPPHRPRQRNPPPPHRPPRSRHGLRLRRARRRRRRSLHLKLPPPSPPLSPRSKHLADTFTPRPPPPQRRRHRPHRPHPTPANPPSSTASSTATAPSSPPSPAPPATPSKTSLALAGIPLRLIDTAGLRSSPALTPSTNPNIPGASYVTARIVTSGIAGCAHPHRRHHRRLGWGRKISATQPQHLSTSNSSSSASPAPSRSHSPTPTSYLFVHDRHPPRQSPPKSTPLIASFNLVIAPPVSSSSPRKPTVERPASTPRRLTRPPGSPPAPSPAQGLDTLRSLHPHPTQAAPTGSLAETGSPQQPPPARKPSPPPSPLSPDRSRKPTPPATPPRAPPPRPPLRPSPPSTPSPASPPPTTSSPASSPPSASANSATYFERDRHPRSPPPKPCHLDRSVTPLSL